MKYNRHILGEAVASATRCANRDNKPYYVHPTYYGWAVVSYKPPCSSYVMVAPNAQPVKVEPVVR